MFQPNLERAGPLGGEINMSLFCRLFYALLDIYSLTITSSIDAAGCLLGIVSRPVQSLYNAFMALSMILGLPEAPMQFATRPTLRVDS